MSDPTIFTSEPRDLVSVVQVVGAAGALGIAAFGLVDATKAFGGVALLGYGRLCRCIDRYFAPALDRALGEKDAWREVVRARWLNGQPRAEQKATIRALVRLGLAADTAPTLAAAGHVDEARLKQVAEKVAAGTFLDDSDNAVLNRMDAAIEAHLDAAFDLGEHHYRNLSRLMAGTFAILLAVAAAALLEDDGLTLREGLLAGLVGLVAVPLAPLAKDLASSISAAAQGVKSVKRSRDGD